MKFLIVGKNSFLGGRLNKYLSNKNDIDLKSYNLIKKKNYDVLIHLSGPNAEECNRTKEQSIKLRKKITTQLLKYSKKNNIRYFFYISTTRVYFKQKFVNEKSKLNTDSFYAKSHLAAEKEINKFKSKNPNINYKILRLSNCFGYPSKSNLKHWKMIINNICQNIFRKNKIILKSNIDFYRDYLSTLTFCRIIEKLIEKNSKELIFNITSGKSIKISNIAKKIQVLLDKKFKKKILIHSKLIKNEKKIIFSNKKILKNIGPIKNNFETELLDLLIYCNKKFKKN